MSMKKDIEISCYSNGETQVNECSCKHAKTVCQSLPEKHLNWSDKEISFGRKRQQFNPYKKLKHNYFPEHNDSYSLEDISMQKIDSETSNFKSNKLKSHYESLPTSYMHNNKSIKRSMHENCYKPRYGNFHQYYGYRNQGSQDSRLLCMKKEWFYLKDVLDIGCNAGHFTLSVARDYSPNSVIGMDIDGELVKMAKKNVRHYIKYDALTDSDFPLSLVMSYGPVAQSLDPKYRYSCGKIPFNVQFVQGNYILPSDEMLQWQEPYFDTILCLSLTKWIHLNWGDEGIQRLFHRAYAHLRPGGCLILEAQSFQSYSKRRKITEEMYQHYNKIKILPEMFNEYLLNEVGFKSCELVDTPAHSSKGFSRPIYLFIKEDEEATTTNNPKHIIYNSDSEGSCNYSDVEQISD